MASSDPSLRRLARQLVDVDQRLKNLETVPQLAHSSLDDQGLPVYDADGRLTVTLGRQPDGTWGAKPVAGPVPPAPVGLDAEGDAGTVRASWQGVFWAGAALPMDFEAVQVLVDGLVYAAIHDPQGGSVSVPAMPGERVVSFRTLSQAGVVSEPTVFGNVTVEPRVSEQMQELGENLSELRDVTLPELSDELDDARTDLQSKLDAANARIDDIVVDGGGSGNFTTYSINEPSGEGTGEGDQWFRVVNGEVLGQWRWDGAAWQAVTLTDAVIAGIDLSKLISNGNLSEVVANKMFTDIFTSNKITSQEIAAGSITTEKIAAEGIIADVIQGGSFVGESFEGGEFTGGVFQTSDDLPGAVRFSDTAAGGAPGLEVTPVNTAGYDTMPRIGPAAPPDGWMPGRIGGEVPLRDGLNLTGGESASGDMSGTSMDPQGTALYSVNPSTGTGAWVYVRESEAGLRYRPDRMSPTNESWVWARAGDAQLGIETPDGRYGQIYATTSMVRLSYIRPTGSGSLQEDGQVRVDDSGVLLQAGFVDGQQKAFRIDDTGIWVDAERDGTLNSYNLEETAQDSGWHNGTIQPDYSLHNNLVPKARKAGNAIYLSGGVAGDGIGANTSQHVLTLPAGFHPTKDWLYVMGSSSSGAASPLWVIKTNGEVLLRTAAVTGNYYMMDGISFLPD